MPATPCCEELNVLVNKKSKHNHAGLSLGLRKILTNRYGGLVRWNNLQVSPFSVLMSQLGTHRQIWMLGRREQNGGGLDSIGQAAI